MSAQTIIHNGVFVGKEKLYANVIGLNPPFAQIASRGFTLSCALNPSPDNSAVQEGRISAYERLGVIGRASSNDRANSVRNSPNDEQRCQKLLGTPYPDDSAKVPGQR